MTIVSTGPFVRVQNASLSADQVHGNEQAFFNLVRYFIPNAVNNFPPAQTKPILNVRIQGIYSVGYADVKTTPSGV